MDGYLLSKPSSQLSAFVAVKPTDVLLENGREELCPDNSCLSLGWHEPESDLEIAQDHRGDCYDWVQDKSLYFWRLNLLAIGTSLTD